MRCGFQCKPPRGEHAVIRSSAGSSQYQLLELHCPSSWLDVRPHSIAMRARAPFRTRTLSHSGVSLSFCARHFLNLLQSQTQAAAIMCRQPVQHRCVLFCNQHCIGLCFCQPVRHRFVPLASGTRQLCCVCVRLARHLRYEHAEHTLKTRRTHTEHTLSTRARARGPFCHVTARIVVRT